MIKTSKQAELVIVGGVAITAWLWGIEVATFFVALLILFLLLVEGDD